VLIAGLLAATAVAANHERAEALPFDCPVTMSAATPQALCRLLDPVLAPTRTPPPRPESPYHSGYCVGDQYIPGALDDDAQCDAGNLY
jgi:hypothetical protein